MKREVLDGLLAARAARRPIARLSWLTGGREQLVEPGAGDLEAALAEAVARALDADGAVLAESEDGPVFVHPFNPPLRLAIVGAVHIAQHLSEYASATT